MNYRNIYSRYVKNLHPHGTATVDLQFHVQITALQRMEEKGSTTPTNYIPRLWLPDNSKKNCYST